MTAIDQTYLVEPETRVTNAATGGQKGTKLTQLGSLDPASLIEVARVAGMGASKYSAYNFMKGTDWSLMFNAMQRHALRYWAGEDNDPESGLHHMAHAAWMALALVGFALRETGNDDRPPSINDCDVATVDKWDDLEVVYDLPQYGLQFVQTDGNGNVVEWEHV